MTTDVLSETYLRFASATQRKHFAAVDGKGDVNRHAVYYEKSAAPARSRRCVPATEACRAAHSSTRSRRMSGSRTARGRGSTRFCAEDYRDVARLNQDLLHRSRDELSTLPERIGWTTWERLRDLVPGSAPWLTPAS